MCSWATASRLVLQGQTTPLTTVPNQFNASQLEISTSAANGNAISGNITSGDLGGLLAARTQVINPALNQLGQIATALSQTVNSQQSDGLDLSGNLGANIFSVGTPVATASSKNTDAVTASVSVNANGLGALTADNYLLSFKAGAPTLTDTTTGVSVTPTGAGTVASPYTANGVSIVLSGAPAAGDQFLIQPTATAAANLKVVLTDPSKIAAAGAISDRGGRHQYRRGHHQLGHGAGLHQPQLAHAGHHHLHHSAHHLLHQRRAGASPTPAAATSM